MSGLRHRKRPLVSSEPAQQEEEEERASSKGLDKAAIRNFVLTELARPDRMGPDWLNDDDKAQWSEWLDAEPDNVGSVSAAEMPLPIQMPRKCLPRSAELAVKLN